MPLYHAYWFDDIVDSYACQDLKKEDYEVIFMVTSNSPDPMICTINRVAKINGLNWQAHNVSGESNCKARNLGTKLAKGDIVLFIDGDQLLAPHLFTKHVEAHFDPTRFPVMFDRYRVGVGICNINVSRRNNDFDIWMPVRSGQTMARRINVQGNARKFVDGMHISQAIGFADWHNMDDFEDYINVVGRNVSFDRGKFIEIGMWDEELAYSETTKSRGWEDLSAGLNAFTNHFTFKMVPSWTVHLEHPSMAKDGGIDNIVKVVKKYPWFLDRDDWWAIRYNRDEIRRKAGL